MGFGSGWGIDWVLNRVSPLIFTGLFRVGLTKPLGNPQLTQYIINNIKKY